MGIRGSWVVGRGSSAAGRRAAEAWRIGGWALVLCLSALGCDDGGTAPADAADFLVTEGHGCVRNVLGGMSAWRSAGVPVVPP